MLCMIGSTHLCPLKECGSSVEYQTIMMLQEPAVSQEDLDRTIAKNSVVSPPPKVVLSSTAQRLNDQLSLLDAELLLDTRTASEMYF